MSRLIHILIIGISVLLCCNSIGRSEHTLTLDWSTLSDTTKYSAIYLQLNFLKYPADEAMGKDILNFRNSNEYPKMKLSNKQMFQLSQLISDTSNYSEGDCGTFHLNAGFIIYEKDKIVGKINIGCGFNQWNFTPDNNLSKFGLLNEKGFVIMEKLLDDVNLSNK